MTKICSALWALAGGLCLAFSSAAFAAAPPMIPVTVTPANGLPGSAVQPAFSFEVTGYKFGSFDLVLRFADPVLSFDLGGSRVTYEGQTMPWTDLTGFGISVQPSEPGNIAVYKVTAFDFNEPMVTSPLILRPSFVIRNGAPVGATTVFVSGSMADHPTFGELDFDSSTTVTVSAVPEPEMWLLWLAGAGLVAWKRRSALNA